MSVKISTYNKFFRKRNSKIDTVNDKPQFDKNLDVLNNAYQQWEALRKVRRYCKRNSMFVKGEQWEDLVKTPDGVVSEAEHIKSRGKVPLVNNRIGPLVTSILGQFSQSKTEPVCSTRDRDDQRVGEMMSIMMQYVYKLNSLWEVDRRELQSFLNDGIGVFRTGYGRLGTNNTLGSKVDTVNVNRFFVDSNMEDFRHWDCTIVGEIHDIPLMKVIAQFSNGSPEKAEEIKQIYRYNYDKLSTSLDAMDDRHFTDIDFYIPDDASSCRVIEVWTKEAKERISVHDRLNGEYYKVELSEKKNIERINQERIKEQSEQGVLPEDMRLLEYEWFVDEYWYYRFMSPFGDVLKEGETEYWHKSHPYSFKLFPFYNGEVHSYVSNLIDQQKYINRLITMQDFIMSSSAKGVLMFPESAKPKGMNMNEVAEQWVKQDGIIYYVAKAGIPEPKQVITNTSNTGAYDMIRLQLEMLKDNSGVSDAMRGSEAKSGVSGSLYAQQTQNSSINLVDVLESYRKLREDRDLKLMQVTQQYYEDLTFIDIAGSSYTKESKIFDPEKVRDVEFDLTLSESPSSASYRMVQNQMLLELYEKQAITVKQLLEIGAFPFADKLLQSIESAEKDIKAEQQQLSAGQPIQDGNNVNRQQQFNNIQGQIQGLQMPKQ